MPTYKQETQQYHIERIKEVLALKPAISDRALADALEKDRERPLKLDRRYLDKLRHKLYRERALRYNKAVIDRRLAEIQDRTEAIIPHLWRILLTSTNDMVRVVAAKAIIEADHRFLEAQMDAGIFERKLGTVDVEHKHEHTIAPELLLPIMATLQHYGMVRKETEKTNDTINQPALPDASGATGK